MRYNTNALKIEASQIKTYIEKNRKAPRACSLSTGEILSPYSIAYLLSSIVNDKSKQKDYDLSNVIIYNPAKMYVDTISNENVMKDDYLVMIKNFLNFCEKNHRVPRFVTTQKSQTRVSFELYLYCICKIVMFIDKNKVLPNYCNFNKGFVSDSSISNKTVKKEVKQSTSTSKKTNTCSNPYTSKPHLTDSDLGQDTPYGCANNSEQQALYKLTGKRFKESELAKLSGTTSKGTGHQGINTCIAAISKKTGIKLTVEWMYFSDLGKTIEERFEALAKIICKSNKAVITHIKYINGGEDVATSTNKGFGHYETIEKIDIKKKTVRVLNSLGTKKANGGYVGKLQERPYRIEASYLAYTSGGQKAICIITKG